MIRAVTGQADDPKLSAESILVLKGKAARNLVSKIFCRAWKSFIANRLITCDDSVIDRKIPANGSRALDRLLNRWLAMVSNTHTEQKPREELNRVQRPIYILFSENFRQQLSDEIMARSFQYRTRYFLLMISAADPSSFRIRCNSHYLYAP